MCKQHLQQASKTFQLRACGDLRFAATSRNYFSTPILRSLKLLSVLGTRDGKASRKLDRCDVRGPRDRKDDYRKAYSALPRGNFIKAFSLMTR